MARRANAPHLRLALWAGLAAAAGLGATGCSDHENPATGPIGVDGVPAEWPRPKHETVEIKVAGHPVTVEIADTPETRRYGFMFVTQVPDDRGMLFVYPRKRPGLSFWMRNTRVPLDLLYLEDDGRIINIHPEMRPRRDRPGYEAAAPCRFVLELPGGWLRRHGVWMNDRVEFPVGLAERARPDGFDGENIPDLLGQAED